MTIFNNKGISSLAVIGIMMILAFFGTAIVYLLGTSQVIRANDIVSAAAFYEMQAGLEYAMRNVYNGDSPVVAEPGKAFGNGSFVISQSGQILTVTGRSGSAQATYRIRNPPQSDCIELDVHDADFDEHGKKLRHIKMRKICLEQVVVDQMIFSWVENGGERLRKIKISDKVVYDNPSGASSGDLIDVADVTLANKDKKEMNEVDFNNSMEGKTFTLTLIMGDHTTTATTFNPS